MSRDALVVARAISDAHGLPDDQANAIAETAVRALGLEPIRSIPGQPRKPPVVFRTDAWSDEDLAELRRLWPDHTAKDISQALRRTEPAVFNKADFLNLPKKGRGEPRPSGSR